MKALWLSTLLVIGSTLVIAQGNSGTCDITLDRGLTVPRLCYNSIQNRLNDSRRNLNFTLTNDSKLIFAPLPENRQVEIEIDDNSDGLESWSNLANAFVDSVRSGSLPYSDVILPYLESAVDSPISNSSCFIPSTSTVSTSEDGDGDVDINELLNDFGEWWTPIIVVTVLGPVFGIIFIVVGICLCCCRMCGKCGGDLQQEQRDSNDKRCIVLYIMVICCICLLFVGVVFAFISNEKVNSSIREMDDTVNTAVDNSLDFVEDTQREANITVDRYDEVNAFVQCEINNTHISIGGLVIEQFEGPVGGLINDSLELAAQLNESIDALQQVNDTVLQLIDLTDRLQMELDNITAQTVQLNMSCGASTNPNVTVICNMIPTMSYMVEIDYTDVYDVSPVLAELQQQSGNIETEAIEANDIFYAIPCDIRDQITQETRDILDEADRFREEIANITADIERELNDVLDEDGFVGDIRTQSSDTQEAVDEYDTPRYVIGIILCSLTLVVVVILIVGLVLGGIGFRRETEPQDRSAMSNCGGKILLGAVYSMFGFAMILLILASLTFFLGANMLKVCYSVAEDPPNDLPSYELFTQIIDNNELWGGSLLGCFVLEDSTVQLTLTEMLNECRDNRPLYQVAKLAQRPGLNLENVTNISSQIPNLDSLFEDLEDQVQFDRNQILSDDTIESLQNYTDAGLEDIDYTGYINQINSIISTLNVNQVISQLEVISEAFGVAGETMLMSQTDMIIATIQRVNDTTIAEINNLTSTLNAQIEFLSNITVGLNASVDAVIAEADRTFAALNNSNIVFNQSRAVLDRVIAYADSYANWAVDNLENQIGRCRPLYATYNNVYYDVCEDAVDGINGFWLAIGWCVLFFIPTIVFAVWLSHYLRRMREWNSDVVPYDPDDARDIRMKDLKS